MSHTPTPANGQPVTGSAGLVGLPEPLFEGHLIQRYKRFLADIALETGETVTAHCPNPGSMMGLKAAGMRAWVSRSSDPKRKLPYTLQLLEADGGLVGINTNLPNRIAERGIAGGLIPELPADWMMRREVRYGENSRIDLLLEPPDGITAPITYVEVKNVHLRRLDRYDGRMAEFPDSVTIRGAKHLRELAAIVAKGKRAVMLFIIQRMDCAAFTLADDLDPAYAAAFAEAQAAGVETFAYACHISLKGIRVERRLPIRI